MTVLLHDATCFNVEKGGYINNLIISLIYSLALNLQYKQ